MQRFTNKQRIEVDKGELEGLRGTVLRLRKSDAAAWCRMDSRPTLGEIRFPFRNQRDGRENDVLLYPWECIPEPTA